MKLFMQSLTLQRKDATYQQASVDSALRHSLVQHQRRSTTVEVTNCVRTLSTQALFISHHAAAGHNQYLFSRTPQPPLPGGAAPNRHLLCAKDPSLRTTSRSLACRLLPSHRFSDLNRTVNHPRLMRIQSTERSVTIQIGRKRTAMCEGLDIHRRNEYGLALKRLSILSASFLPRFLRALSLHMTLLPAKVAFYARGPATTTSTTTSSGYGR